MSYEEHRTNPMGHPADAWLGPGYADMAVDELRCKPDGSVTAIQYKRTGRDPRSWRRVDPQDLLLDCPECAGKHGSVHGDLSASNLTASASGAYFRGVDLVTIDTCVLVLIGQLDEVPSAVDLRDVLSGLTPAKRVLITTADADHGPLAGLSGAPVVDSVDSGKVVRLLEHWDRVSHSEPVPSAAFETLATTLTRQLVVGSARCAVRAAYLARDAVMHRDPSVSRLVVARFAETWLGLRPTDENVAATGNALLQAPLDGVHPGGDHAAVRRLRADVRHQRRAWRPLRETQLCGRPVDSLDRPLWEAGADGSLTVADTVAGGVRPDAVDGWNDVRLPRVLASLRPEELRVAMSKVHQDITWSAAAETCGMTAEFGERVRRKLKRLGDDLMARIEAAKGRPRLA